MMNEYHALLVKMQQNSSIMQVAMKNLEHLVSIQILLSFKLFASIVKVHPFTDVVCP
jgi:hypothetical protein